MNKNMSASNFPALPRSTVTVRNAGETTLPAWSAAAPVAGSDNRFSGSELFFDVIPASPSDRFWGVLTENISPGCCGTMVVNGVVPALIGEDEGIGEYAVPGENGLLPGSSGRAELLRRPGSSGEPGLIMLGVDSGSGFNYTGYFKIVNIEGARFEIINGYKDDDTICGRTDVPGFEEIPRFSFELAYNAATVALCLYRIGENYDMQFTIGKWNDGFAQMMIGNVYADGKVEQSYMGGTIFFGREWFL